MLVPEKHWKLKRGVPVFFAFSLPVTSTENKEKDKEKDYNNDLYSYSLIRKHTFS